MDFKSTIQSLYELLSTMAGILNIIPSLCIGNVSVRTNVLLYTYPFNVTSKVLSNLSSGKTTVLINSILLTRREAKIWTFFWTNCGVFGLL